MRAKETTIQEPSPRSHAPAIKKVTLQYAPEVEFHTFGQVAPRLRALENQFQALGNRGIATVRTRTPAGHFGQQVNSALMTGPMLQLLRRN